MSIFQVLISNPIINSAFMGWFLAQLWKFLYHLIFKKECNFAYFISSGGMPSSHSSLVMALTVCIFRIYGFLSAEFAISLAFSVIVMYDASGVRRAAGEQAKIINQIVEVLKEEDFEVVGKKLKEILGHSPIEVIVGALLGIVVGWVMPI